MPEPGKNSLHVTLDKEQLKNSVEAAFLRIGRAGATAIVDAAGRELARLQGVLAIAKEILKPK
jgi:hypothetical protein